MNRNLFRLLIGGLLAIPVAGGLFFIMQYLIASADPKIDDSKTRKLADILHVGIGDRVAVEVLNGRKPHFVAAVENVVDEYLGAFAYAEIGALSERRIALLIDANLSGLPAFLVKGGGLNSGFMMAQVTAAALASENKSHAHPASVDSLPTSANQEDHVSMATYAARRLHTMLDNVSDIVAIELLAAAQGIDFHQPQKSSPAIEEVMVAIRGLSPVFENDRSLSSDIRRVAATIDDGDYCNFAQSILPSLSQ